MTWLHMAHVGPLPPMWDLLEHQPAAETLYFQSASISGQRRRYTDIHSDVLLHRRLRRGKRIISGCGQYQSNECRLWRWFSDKASNTVVNPAGDALTRKPCISSSSFVPTTTIPTKRTRADALSDPDYLKATVGKHCQGCGRPRYARI